MKIAFLMDKLEGIDPVFETTASLMYECNQRGHTVFFFWNPTIFTCAASRSWPG